MLNHKKLSAKVLSIALTAAMALTAMMPTAAFAETAAKAPAEALSVENSNAADHSDNSQAQVNGTTDTVLPESNQLPPNDAVLSSNEDPDATIQPADGEPTLINSWSDDALGLTSTSDVTITLKKNVTGSITIPQGARVTLDLNGKTLTNTEGKHTITNSGTLTIKDSTEAAAGTIDNVTHQCGALVNQTGATVTLESGILTRSKEDPEGDRHHSTNSWYVVDNHGTMDVEGGTIKNTSKYSSLIRNLGKLTVSGGTIQNDFIAIKNDENQPKNGTPEISTLMITGGTITSTEDQAINNWTTATIQDAAQIHGKIGTWSYGNGTQTKPSDSVVIAGQTVISGITIEGDVYVAAQKDHPMPANSEKTPFISVSNSTVNGNVGYVNTVDADISNIFGKIEIKDSIVNGDVINPSDHGNLEIIGSTTVSGDVLNTNEGTTEIKGGTVRNVSNEGMGTLKISGGTISGNVSNKAANSLAFTGGNVLGNMLIIGTNPASNDSPVAAGTLAISGGTIEGNVINTGQLAMSGGTVKGNMSNEGEGSFTFSNGAVKGNVSNTSTNPSAIVMSGGTIDGSMSNTGAGAIAISGGTVKGSVSSADTESNPIHISGGTFTTADVSSFIPVGSSILITFDGNGGQCDLKSTVLTLASGTAKLSSLPTAIRSGSYTFDGWYTAASGGTKVDTTTPFEQNATIYAQWIYTGGGGGGSHHSGGGGGSSSGSSSSFTSAKPMTIEISVTANVDKDGHATASVTQQTISDAVKSAKDQASKNGTALGDITAVIKVDTGSKNADSVTISLPKTMQEQVESDKVAKVAIQLSQQDITLGMDLAAITSMNKQANADVQLSVTRLDASKLSTEARDAIGSRPAFDLKATYNDGKNSITNFASGTVSMEIPYTLQTGEAAGNVCAVYVDDNGKVNYISNSSYNAKDKAVRFTTNHFSVYGVGYKEESVTFSDIADHWAKNDIEFVASKGVMSGTGDGKFTPDGAMTRGMFVTTLGRLAKVDAASYTANKFSDVQTDAYYAPYVNWAAEKGIVSGTSATTFSPDQPVTRQEMAVMMSNYAKAMGSKLPETHPAVTFTDESSIADWAAEAVAQMQTAGIISGRDDNSFDPEGTATRGEVASLLHRFVEAIAE